ncbi:WXG100 family type VII secretion target [Candidatus Contubernalis alkaliaceticus]|uniref:WXG100 family type VII secretion target n=1 Tax=Candidatus Contubernalis alkaliaceticus TaxID=338645 RepID=UPI001F4C0893|nr:WXG100 family type VII secretion target [Candidatus Contubernalis alkalaceticus]UNC91120.1 WXG100 family type VII secretion target [Candidatus Contubernalis alkalaceticus]
MTIINFNYNKAINQSREVDAVASEMLTTANTQLQAAINSIGACWRGDASEQFLHYCHSTQVDIRTQANKLQDLAARIRTVARIIAEAEERAGELQRQQAAAAKANDFSNGGGGGGR